MKRLAAVHFALALALMLSSVARSAPASIEDAFVRPPDDARPWVFWFWSDGNLTREGITADLEAMQRVGIGGALIMEVDQNVPPGPVRFMTPAWQEMFAFAMSEAARLGLQINLNNDAGWTGSGGPWVTAEDSMQKVVWKERRVSGPQHFAGALEQPETVEGHYRDIALLAFPTPASEAVSMRDAGVKVTASATDFAGDQVIDGDRATGAALARSKKQEPTFVQLEFSQPFVARSLEVVLAPGAAQRVLAQLQASDDGRSFRDVAQFQPGGAPQTFAAVQAKVFRIVFVASGAAAAPLRINELALSSVHRIDRFAAKSGLGLAASSADTVETDAGVSIARDAVIDLTSKLHDGRLAWDVPAGDWTLLRIGHTSTGKTNHPSPTEGRGLEVDKLSRAALDRHYDGFVGKLIATGKATDALTTVHVDSWEVGYQNWTPEFRDAFRRLRGYDPLRWLPVFTGRVVDNAALSERFLWDVRRTISELLNENYATRLAERAHADGRRFSLEGYRNGPFDCLSYAGRADLPVGEFWLTRDPANVHPSVKTMTSAGHVYGKNIIGAEAFTASDAMGRQRNHPYSLKAIGDAAFCAGINQFIVHRYSMQPWVDDRKPGMTMGPWGVEYERTATWWEQTKPWHEYLARCQYLLRQGRFVADLCYLQSEEGINNPTLPAEVKPSLPEGYDFDFCSDEAVRTRMSVQDGRIVLPDGLSYRVLVLPQQRLMTPALLRKIRELVRAGAIVFGPPPVRSPSMAGYPQCDEEVRQLVADIWGEPGAPLERSLAERKAIWGVALEDVLAKLHAGPDFVFRNMETNAEPRTESRAPIRYIHRTLADREIYFVANLSDAPANIVASFRDGHAEPELWHADGGAIETAAVCAMADGRARLPLELAARDSVFIVFKHNAPQRMAPTVVAVKKDGALLLESGAVPVTPRRAPAKPYVDVVRSFTMAAWVKPEADTALPAEDFGGTSAYSVSRNDVLFPPPGHEVFGKLDAAGAGFAVGRNGVTVLEHGDHHFPATLVHRARIDDWTHVAVVFDRGTPNLYLNGELVRTGLKTLLTVHGGVGVPHGREVDGFRGEHSALKQFERALSAAEIRELMQTTPKTAAEPTARPAPAANVAAPGAHVRFAAAGTAWVGEPGRYEFVFTNRGARTVAVADIPAPLAVTGPWTLHFPPGGGAPAQVEWPQLVSWTQHPEAGVKYFSGTATYTTQLDVPAERLVSDRRTWLELGDVQVIAEVKLNGRELGTLWKPPFSLDVTDVLRAGRNELEVRVTNLWVNRLIGDEQLPLDREWTKVPRRNGYALKSYPDWLQRGERSPTGRVTFATWKHYEKNAPLLPSGLLGPVTLRTEAKIDLSAP